MVCAPIIAEERLIVITTYQPNPSRWDLAGCGKTIVPRWKFHGSHV